MLAELFTFVAAADTCIVAIPKDFDHSLLIEHIRTVYDFQQAFWWRFRNNRSVK
jgi:hypothetical protein